MPPPPPASPPRRPWLRPLRRALATGALAVVLGVVALVSYAAGSLRHVDVGGSLGDSLAGLGFTPPQAAAPDSRNVLVVGTDSRAALDPALAARGTTDPGGPPRADAVMVVHVPPDRDAVTVVSFPRDLKVHIPGEGIRKLGEALVRGGAELLVATVERYSGIPIDHYVEVDIAGFLAVVDLLGGVEVCLDTPLEDPAAGADLPAGPVVLRGADAAAYVRARKSDPRGDLGRIERQQRFARAAVAKILRPANLANPLRMKRLIDRGATAVATDSGFGPSEMFRLVWSLRSVDAGEVTMVTVPAEPGPKFVTARPEQAEALFQAVRLDTPLPTTTPPPTPGAPAAPLCG